MSICVLVKAGEGEFDHMMWDVGFSPDGVGLVAFGPL